MHVTLSDGRGGSVSAPGLARWLARIAPPRAPRELAIALVSDARIRSLNRQFRRKDMPTDVLSFEPNDIVIARGVARRQAREAGHSYADELKVLALHGLLHLMGYDHHRGADAARMRRLEIRLRRKGGLGAGLIERAQAAAEPRERKAPAARAGRRSVPARSGGAERVRAGVWPRERKK